MGSDDEDKEAAKEAEAAQEAREARRAGSGRRLTFSLTLLVLLALAVVYLTTLSTSQQRSAWHPPLDTGGSGGSGDGVRRLWRALVDGYSFSAGLLDVAALIVARLLCTAALLSLAAPDDARRTLLQRAR
eukprot:CAMPEP_0197598874 /NCGR_PEP_ID=MMETSP1326-20131121/30202_1 /TAXON_ID=1155430 /ORGANISM="Genus nov. species nov., Strain RCC2288" /LENGTH=129 /DNA_ID=CAMNT_0043165741 /DNA_START=1 /DNA_END=386 /DNA_ORIENTATION=+